MFGWIARLLPKCFQRAPEKAPSQLVLTSPNDAVTSESVSSPCPLLVCEGSPTIEPSLGLAESPSPDATAAATPRQERRFSPDAADATPQLALRPCGPGSENGEEQEAAATPQLAQPARRGDGDGDAENADALPPQPDTGRRTPLASLQGVLNPTPDARRAHRFLLVDGKTAGLANTFSKNAVERPLRSRGTPFESLIDRELELEVQAARAALRPPSPGTAAAATGGGGGGGGGSPGVPVPACGALRTPAHKMMR